MQEVLTYFRTCEPAMATGRRGCSATFSPLHSRPRMLNADRKSKDIRGREGMSRALAVFHGRFGRATVYQLNRRLQRACTPRGAPDFPCRRNAGADRRLRSALAAHRGLRRRGQPLGTAQLPADGHGERRHLLRALRQSRMVRAQRCQLRKICASAARISNARMYSTGTFAARPRWSAAPLRSGASIANSGN